MVFLRSKRVKGKKYYYIVESKIVKGKIKQFVLCYLGNADKILKVFKQKKKA
ncbi:MAG: hypothetical protein Q8N99_01855 [Nanoarchaeota archaeon]|nr:hypothetical protein [Nanoarchaeota archaeon]